MRLGFARLLIAAGCILCAPGPISAVTEIDITQGNIRPIPIAIAPFMGLGPESQALASGLTGIIEGNLERSGLFKIINRGAFIERIFDINMPPRFQDWRVINTETLVVGMVSEAEAGRVKAQFRLWDVYSGKELKGEEFYATAKDWRRIGHIISDAIYQRLTGERGYFDSRMVFVDESGPKKKRIKRLAIMDQDGENLRYLTNGENLVLTPRFSPATREITYTSYAGDQPKVLRYDLTTGKQEVVGDFPGMTFAPRYSPDGRAIIMSLQRENASNIYVMELQSRRFYQLTNTNAIDTGPSFSPDGRQIVFESDRSGHQQLYVMSADGSGARQITRGGGRYSTPVWSPRGDLIAFTKQIGGQFLIGVIKPDGTGERILTEGYHNEGPSWSPNGRVILFFRDTPGEASGPQLFTIDLTGYNERRLRTPAFASDPAWSSLND